MEAARSKRRESPSGLHFWQLYQNCPREFYFKYVLGLKPKYTSKPLVLGGVFHDAKARLYKTWDEDEALKELNKSFRIRAKELDPTVDREELRERTMLMFLAWASDFAKRDQQTYRIVEVEHEWKITLPNGFVVTARPDAVVRMKREPFYFILETKTSSFSVTLTKANVTQGDQATMYTYGFRQKWPKRRFGGVIPDITYWNKQSTDVTKIVNQRTDVVQRTSFDLKAFELYTMDVLNEIARRVKAVESGEVEPIQAFGRNTSWCFSYHRTCPYADICRRNVDPDRVPEGFVRDEWKDREAIARMNLAFDLRRFGNDEQTRRVLYSQAQRAAKTQSADRYRRAGARDGADRRPAGRCRAVRGDRAGRYEIYAARERERAGVRRLLRSWIFTRIGKAERNALVDACRPRSGREAGVQGGARKGDRRGNTKRRGKKTKGRVTK